MIQNENPVARRVRNSISISISIVMLTRLVYQCQCGGGEGVHVQTRRGAAAQAVGCGLTRVLRVSELRLPSDHAPARRHGSEWARGRRSEPASGRGGGALAEDHGMVCGSAM